MSVEYLNLAPMEFGQKAAPRKMLRTGPIVDVPVASDPLYRHMSVSQLRKRVNELRKSVAPATSKMDRPALVKELANLEAAEKAAKTVTGADMITKEQDKIMVGLKSDLRTQKLAMKAAASKKKAAEEKEAKKAERAAKKAAKEVAKAEKAAKKATKAAPAVPALTISDFMSDKASKAKKAAAAPAKEAPKPKRAVSAYAKFVGEKMKAGMSMKDAAAAWKAQK